MKHIRLLTVMILLSALDAHAQKLSQGKWMLQRIVMDRDTLFLKGDSLMRLKTERRKHLQDTITRKVYGNDWRRMTDTAYACQSYKIIAMSYLIVRSDHSLLWYMPATRAEVQDKPSTLYFKTQKQYIYLYNDKARKNLLMTFQLVLSDSVLTLVQPTEPKTVLTFSKSIY